MKKNRYRTSPNAAVVGPVLLGMGPGTPAASGRAQRTRLATQAVVGEGVNLGVTAPLGNVLRPTRGAQARASTTLTNVAGLRSAGAPCRNDLLSPHPV